MMTGGQNSLFVEDSVASVEFEQKTFDVNRAKLTVIKANNEEIEQHHQRLEAIKKVAGGRCVWGNSNKTIEQTN
jgi:DNA polymerase-3 subunit epsilon